MSIQRTNATMVAVKEEATFKAPVTFADSDVIAYTKFSMKPAIEEVKREYVNSKTLLKGKPLQGKSTADGSATVELMPDGTTPTKLTAHALYLSSVGAYTDKGAAITANLVEDHVAAADGDAGAYYLNDAEDGVKSLGVKYVIGGNEANSVDIRGVLVSSFKLAMPTQGIVTSDFSLSGSTGFIPVSGTALNEVCNTDSPFVARSMTVKVSGTDVCASDLSFEITNTVQDFVCTTDSGIGQKTVTEREIKGSFKIAFENLNEINAYNSATSLSIFAKATNAEGHEFAIYISAAERTSLDIADDSGTLVQTVEFTVADSCGANNKPIMIAIK